MTDDLIIDQETQSTFDTGMTDLKKSNPEMF